MLAICLLWLLTWFGCGLRRLFWWIDWLRCFDCGCCFLVPTFGVLRCFNAIVTWVS